MKNLFISKLLLLLLITLGANAASPEFVEKYNYETSYDEALKKAKASDKPIMLVLSTKSCPWCRKLERQTLKKDFIHKIVSQNFTPIALDRDEDSYPKEFTARVVPTIYFINPKNQSTIARVRGYKNKKEYKEILRKIDNAYKGN